MDHVIPLNEQHLRRLGREYLAYYHEDRTHTTLDKSTPGSRALEAPLGERARSTVNLESAVFTIAIAGQKQPEWRYEKTACPWKIGAARSLGTPNLLDSDLYVIG
jgi:hypothetical protein